MEATTEIRLTEFSRGAGCGCKIAPSVLQEILLSDKPAIIFRELLVGNNSLDDAAVYDAGNGTGIISTTDFFMPIVDSAFDFGRIASANAISDVYAMGGKPIMAVAILGWPVEKLSTALAQQVLEGSRKICEEAGIPLAGGHSIDSAEPIFGLAVTGTIDLAHLKKNNTAEEGDLIFITKAIGVGILSTAEKRGVIKCEHATMMVEQMSALNKIGQELGKIKAVHAMTDSTGFGLLGHLIEMAEGSNLSAEVFYNKVPIIDGAKEYLSQRIVPDATYRNWNSYNAKVSFEKGVNVMEAFNILPDPQTNGGLLIAVAAEAEEEITEVLRNFGIEYTTAIGRFISKQEKSILVKNA